MIRLAHAPTRVLALLTDGIVVAAAVFRGAKGGRASNVRSCAANADPHNRRGPRRRHPR